MVALGGAWRIFFRAPRGELAIARISASAESIPKFSCYQIEFDLNRDFNNPFDSEEIDVSVELIAPDGGRLTHPGFWDVPHQCVLDHGREVVRRARAGCWKVRVSPTAIGRYRWTLKATTKDSRTSRTGEFVCVKGDRPGFVRVSATDPRCLEFTNGDYFYPIGHCTRSPVDDRWRASTPDSDSLAERYAAEGTFAYEKWFAKMRESRENFCAIWMTPWWCGLEWTPTLRVEERGRSSFSKRAASPFFVRLRPRRSFLTTRLTSPFISIAFPRRLSSSTTRRSRVSRRVPRRLPR